MRTSAWSFATLNGRIIDAFSIGRTYFAIRQTKVYQIGPIEKVKNVALALAHAHTVSEIYNIVADFGAK